MRRLKDDTDIGVPPLSACAGTTRFSPTVMFGMTVLTASQLMRLMGSPPI